MGLDGIGIEVIFLLLLFLHNHVWMKSRSGVYAIGLACWDFRMVWYGVVCWIS